MLCLLVVTLGIVGPLYFHMSFRMNLLISTKKLFRDFDCDCILSVDQFGGRRTDTLINAEFSDPQTWYLSVYCGFSFCQKCFVTFSVCIMPAVIIALLQG